MISNARLTWRTEVINRTNDFSMSCSSKFAFLSRPSKFSKSLVATEKSLKISTLIGMSKTTRRGAGIEGLALEFWTQVPHNDEPPNVSKPSSEGLRTVVGFAKATTNSGIIPFLIFSTPRHAGKCELITSMPASLVRRVLENGKFHTFGFLCPRPSHLKSR